MPPLPVTEGVPVLIVGAGPAGLVAAIRLREQGVGVRIIDEQAADRKRLYPVLLHARTLNILDTLGVRAPLDWRGRVVKRLGVYTDNLRRVVLDIPSAEEVAPGAMTLPQDVLRQALTSRLADLGTEVEWSTRLTALAQDEAHVSGSLLRRERISDYRPTLEQEWLDVASDEIEAEFIVGADGWRSTVRQALGIDMVQHGKREMYAFYDLVDHHAGDEATLVFNESRASSVYPLQGERSRFSFQIGVGMSHPPGLAQLRQLLGAAMPWYAGETSGFEWAGNAEFHPSVAARFGEGRAWLVGDAAHATGPLGAQSINVGIHEANELALGILEALSCATGPSFATRYAEQRRLEWNRLFGIRASIPSLARAPSWVGQHMTRLLPCLPAGGADLDDLLEQLRVRGE